MNFLKNLSRRTKIYFTALSIILVLVGYLFLQNNWLKVDHIDIKIKNLPEELEGLKIAHVSDLHIPKNDITIKSFVAKIQREKPDLIVMTGDIIDVSAGIDEQDFLEVGRRLAELADTYAVTGNHEVWNNNIEKWKETLEKHQVKVVEDRIEIYQHKGAQLAIMGLKDNGSYSDEYFRNIEEVKDLPKILLAHRPELFPTYYADSLAIKPDLVLSGHAHGGQFRIPFLNKGLVAPDQGFFPTFTSGLYTSPNGVQMVVSRGLGNSIIPIRINNRPHLPIIHLKK